MAIEQKTKVIDGITFETVQFTGRKGLGLQARLLRLVGGSIIEGITLLAKLPRTPGKSALDMDLSGLGDTGGIMEKLAAGLANEDVSKLAVELLSNTTMDGKQITEGVFDLEFAGKYDTAVKAIYFAAESNNFFKFGGIGGLLSKLTPTPPQEQQAD